MFKNLDLLFFLLLFLIFFEFFLILIVKLLKKKFQWIINQDDEFPFQSDAELKNFIIKSYNKDTGWDRKKNTSGYEILNKKKTFYKILNAGYRNTINKNKKTLISVFGDSYAFCRYVNDRDTWESKLEKHLSTCVRNYGVGNFGLDQSFIKYKKTKLPKTTKLIIFAFVPETISRINSFWKHYSEFGNKYGFKPIFKIEKNKLILKKNILHKNTNLEKLKKKIPTIKKIDIFYKRRFLHYVFKFPYTFSYLRSFKRNNLIFLNILMFNIFDYFNLKNKKEFYLKSYNKIVKDNVSDANNMYMEKNYNSHFSKLILMINKNFKNKNYKCLFLILPQMHDLFLSQKNKSNYKSFFKKLSSNNKIDILDTTNIFLTKKNFTNLYLEDKYGGHLSKKGNLFVANELLKYIKSKKLL